MRRVFLAGCASLLWIACHSPSEPGNVPPSASLPDGGGTVQWWLSRYRQMDPGDPNVLRAERLFQRMAVVSAIEPPVPTLLTIETDGHPMALAVPDRHVILTSSALRLCFEGVSEVQGDTRLGYVFAHELAHLKEGVFDHSIAFASLERLGSEDGESLELARLLGTTPEEVQKTELKADQQAIVHLVLAGFDPDVIVSRDSSFFEEWVSQPMTGKAYDRDQNHPSPELRAHLLRSKLEEVVRAQDYFVVGNRAYQLGRYEEAAQLLEKYTLSFPEPSALNNLGLTHYQLASRALAACDGRLVLRFKLPVLLDPRTFSDILVPRGGGAHCYRTPLFLKHKVAAEGCFEQVIRTQPHYLPAQLNHASLMILSGEGAGLLTRRWEMEEVGADESMIELLNALGFYLYVHDSASADEKAAVRPLSELAEKYPRSGEILFDLGSILHEQGEDLQAQRIWRRFVELEPRGAYADHVRAQLRQTPREEPPAENRGPRPESWAGSTREELLSSTSAWPPPLDLPTGRIRFSIRKNGNSLAVLRDGTVQWIESRLDGFSKHDVEERYGTPLLTVPTTVGAFYRYGSFGVEFIGDDAKALVQVLAEN